MGNNQDGVHNNSAQGRGLIVVVVDGRFEVTMEREEVDGVLDTVAGGTEAPDDIVNSAALVARTVRDVVGARGGRRNQA